MADTKIGTIGWHDLTVPHAERVRDFYEAVVGWEPGAIDMGGYSDFTMRPPGGDPVAGVCHARGENAGLPAAWMMYIIVADIERSSRGVVERGGELLTPVRKAGDGRFCVIKDPAGAVCGLYQS